MYTDFDGENFLECVGEVVDMMGESDVLERILKGLDEVLDKDQKLDVLNDLWVM